MTISTLMSAMRLGAMMHELDMFTMQDIADATGTDQAHLASGDIGLEQYIRHRAQNTPWHEVLEMAENERL